jgi:hypothetical protein
MASSRFSFRVSFSPSDMVLPLSKDGNIVMQSKESGP